MVPNAGPEPTLEGLQKAIETLEGQRAILGDQTVDAALAAIQAQMEALEKGEGVGDEVQGDKIGGDKVAGGKTEIAHADQVNLIRGESKVDDGEALGAYLRTTARFGNRLPLAPLDPSGQESAYISLAQVFVGLDAGPAEIPGEEPGTNIRYKAALGHIHDNRRLILLGDPGSGKTTLQRFLSLCLAQAKLAPDGDWLGRLAWSQQLLEENKQKGRIEPSQGLIEEGLRWKDEDIEAEEVHWTADAPIPIYVTLRDLARGEFDPGSPAVIWGHVARQLKREDLADAIKPLQRLAQKGQVIFLLDGVDEVPLDKRPAVWQAIAALDEGAYGDNRWLATCRVLSFTEDEAPPGIPVRTLSPLAEEQVNGFIASWYGALAEAKEIDAHQATTMSTALQSAARRPRLRPLAQNPMLLTIMALVQTYHGTLPDERAKLYKACVETLLLRWQRHKETTLDGEPMPEPLVELETKQDVLERLLWEVAWTAHRETAGQEEAADIPRMQVVAIAEKHLGSLARAEAFLEYTEQRAHLLVGRGGVGERVYAFPHRTFQEYLAACHLVTGRLFRREIAGLAQEPDLWREVLNLAAGELIFNRYDREKVLEGVERMLPIEALAAANEAGWNRVWLAGEMTAVVGWEAAEADEVGRELLPRLRDQLAALITGGCLASGPRALAGRALGRLGDPRPDVKCRVPFLIDIPAGPFLMGSDKGKDRAARENELPQHEVNLPAYRIGKYPVTVAQYQPFVEAGGYNHEGYWTGAGWEWRQKNQIAEPRYWQDAQWTIDNHPLVGVSWYEAAAYCAWLSERYDRAFRLPDEAMWEKAARGNDGRVYPWGDDWDPSRLNSGADEIERTSAVGLFPGGRSAYGLLDCCGNVWEWCSGPGYNVAKYPFERRSYEEDLTLSGTRTIRGGAFDLNQWYVRAAVRFDNYQYFRYLNIGFRVVEHLR